MDLGDAIRQYVAIPDARKAWFLNFVAYNLTISMRGCYEESDHVLRATKLQGANEIQHQITQQIRHYVDEDLKRYPDDSFIRICVEQAAMYKIGGEFRSSLTHCLQRWNASWD